MLSKAVLPEGESEPFTMQSHDINKPYALVIENCSGSFTATSSTAIRRALKSIRAALLKLSKDELNKANKFYPLPSNSPCGRKSFLLEPLWDALLE